MKRGLEIAIREEYNKLHIEGDAKLVVDIVKQLQQGTPVEKISSSWRTAWLVKEISKILKQLAYILPTHVRRKGNEPDDSLANWGCRNRGRSLDTSAVELMQTKEMANLKQLLEKYKSRANNTIENLARSRRSGQEREGRGQTRERTNAGNEVSRQAIWQMTEQGREGTPLESTGEVTNENDSEEGRAESRKAGRSMTSSGKTRTVVTRQEKPGESGD